MIKSITTKLVVFALLLVSSNAIAQSISGKIIDEEKNPLEFASVAVLNAADSTLISYASTDIKGNFKVVEISNGKRIFQINLLGYQVYQKKIDFTGKSLDFGTIILKELDNTLDEVVVSAVIPITIKKDTMAFNAKAFKVRVDDTVEDLLKKLPGVEVDADGKVKAQGEDVSKVYVDGKEFFSGDPSVALKNLSADAIKKIELIDEKSDKSRVTGVDDTNRSKVINLTLKDDRKVNAFGKFQGGYGSDERYLTSLNYNRFSPKMQVSIIARANNVNSSGSDISEIMSFGGGGRGGFRVSRGGSGGSSSGFITTGIAGFNLGYELKSKQNLNADYFYNSVNSESGNVFSKRTEFVGSDKLYSESSSNSNSETKSNKANFSYIDRSSDLRTITLRGRLNSSSTNGSSTSTLDAFEANDPNTKKLENTGTSNSDNKSNSASVNLDYIKRFNKTSKRSFEVEFDFSSDKSDNNSGNTNTKDYTDASKTDEVSLSTQKSNNRGRNINFELQYTEPLNDNHFIEIGGGIKVNNEDEYTDQTQTLNGSNNASSTFTADLFEEKRTTYGSLDYKYNNEKTSITIGSEFQEQTQNFGLTNVSNFEKKYSSFNPSFRFRYRPKRGSWVMLRYSKSLNLPSLSKVSPVENNFNPLFIRKGNQNLTPEDQHSLFAMYGNYNFATGFSFFAHVSYNSTSNAIVNKEDTDIATRVKTSSYVNLGDRDNFSADVNFGNRLKQLGIRYNLGVNVSTSNYQSVINTINNKTNTNNTSFRVTLENNKKDFLDLAVGANISKNNTTFSGTTSNREYIQQSYYIKSDWNITKAFNFNTQYKYDIYTDSNFGTDQTVPIWNASVSYNFLKSKAMNIKLTALDLLNKSVGFSRSSSDNYFEETTKDVLGTYYMVSLTYTLGTQQSSSRGRGRRMMRH
ncbi:TonB-dependent receptor domain-containing protein [Polaribacter gochangensis]|uniref:TonB-dependent receptor domain-containing protein n=1 Tax=Polaribacter gochangensis TaxID=3252903 RepID=UPI003904C051